MAAKDLTRLPMGEPLYIEPERLGLDHRPRLLLLGCLQRNYLMVDVPEADRSLLMKRNLELDIRIFTGAEVLAFATTVHKCATMPFPHLFLTYPREVLCKSVRKAPRVDVDLAFEVVGPEGKQVTCTINNLSTTGCSFLVNKSETFGATGERAQLSGVIEVGGNPQNLTIPVIIRSIKDSEDEPGAVEFGGQFEVMDQIDAIAIHGVVYRALFENTQL